MTPTRGRSTRHPAPGHAGDRPAHRILGIYERLESEVAVAADEEGEEPEHVE